MKRVVALFVALCGLVYVRGNTAIPIWSGWWWAWIIGTCVVAWCGGYVHAQVRRNRRDSG